MVANTFAPQGFQRFGVMPAGAPTMGIIKRKVASGDTTAIGFGDPVVSLNTGYVTRATAGTTQISGIFVGCWYLNTSFGYTRWSPNFPGGSVGADATAYIDTDPAAQYIAQSSGTAITFADIGMNINFTIGTPSTTALGGYSTSYLNQTTIDTTNTLPFRIIAPLTQFLPANSINGTDDTTPYNMVVVAPNYFDQKSLVGI